MELEGAADPDGPAAGGREGGATPNGAAPAIEKFNRK